MPLVYTASAKILAEAPQIPAELARSTVPISGMAQLQILQQQITTRDSLLTLAKKLDIYADSPAKPSDEDIVKDLSSRIRFEQLQLDAQDPGQGVALYAVSFSANKPSLAAKVANELVEMILHRNQRERTDRASSTLEFFNQKVTGLDSDLKQLEARILDFKTVHRDSLPESLDFRRGLQGSLQERLVALEREESDLRTRRNSLIITYTSTGQLPGAVQLSPEQQMLADLNQSLAEQLATFTEESPNIRAIRARILKLQKSLVADRSGEKTQETTTSEQEASTAEKPSFGLDLQLSDVDDRLKVIASEKVTINQRIGDLTQSISETSATETALNSLLRNRTNIQTLYNSAIAQRAVASTGEQIEIRSDGERFSLLESATAPTKAVSPKRRLIVLAGGAGGAGLALALVVLIEMLNKTVRRPKDLAKLLQSEPLGTIPVVRTRLEARAARIRIALAAFFSAGVMPASLAVIHYYYMPLDLALQKLVTGFGWMGAT
jgi:uncharacterized protein involved in exopolysaccharide biosynthesis